MMVTNIMTADVISILVMLIILYGNIFETRRKSKKSSMFNRTIMINVIAAFCDFITWQYEGTTNMMFLLHIATIFTFVAAYLAIYYIITFVNYHMEDKGLPSICNVKAISIYTIICSILTIIGSVSGHLYSYEGGIYTDGPLYFVYLISLLILVVYCYYLLFTNLKHLGKHDSIGMGIFITIPTISMIISGIDEMLNYTYATTALSFLVIYIMFQYENETQSRQREAILTQENRIDDLTKLQNRRAYNEVCDSFDDSLVAGVVFCDLNGLKYTNDHYGHKAGDKMLIDFSELLVQNFRKDEVYRISGDEFVMILKGISNDAFYNRVNLFKNKIQSMHTPIAAIGSSYGSDVGINQLIRLAEEDMYMDKKSFYNRYPMYKR